MKLIFSMSLVLFFNCIFSQNNSQLPKSIHSFNVQDIYGNEFDFKSLKGKKVMIVNTASKCGLTYQYENLEKLYKEYKNDNFIIIGFPANNFLWQEPGSNEKIATFCKENYGVSFPMMGKVSVKGSGMHPIYKFLTRKSENGVIDSSVSWNFQKYLIDEKGFIVKVISPRTKPDDQTVIDWISS